MNRFALAFLLVLISVLLSSTRARAQLHFDVGAEPGVMRRIVLQRADPGTDAGFGPMLELHGHIAVLPLVRAGIYLSHDISPELSTRQVTSFGLRAKVTPPILCGNWRAWAFLGFGYSLVYSPSYHHTYDISSGAGQPQVPTDVAVDGLGGTFFEIPVGIGLGYKLQKPWELTAELGTKVGFGFSGDLYCGDTTCPPNASAPPNPPLLIAPVGYDTLAVYLAVGVSLDL